MTDSAEKKVSLDWFNDEKTAVLFTYSPGWTWDDFYPEFTRQNQLFDESDKLIVHVVVDVRNSSLIPKGGALSSLTRRVTSNKHPKMGKTLIVGMSGFMRVMANALARFMGEARREFYYLDTMEEAEKLLKEFAAKAHAATGD